MERVNFGKAKEYITNVMINNVINENENKDVNITKKFVNLLENHPALQIEFEIYNNIETANIPDKSLAKEYVERNISLYKDVSWNDMNKAHSNLNKIMEGTEYTCGDGREELYNAIHTLIVAEGRPNSINVNSFWSAREVVLEHIMKNKTDESLNESQNDDKDWELIVNKSVELFNKKYSNLNETEKKVISLHFKRDSEGKKELFESLKSETLSILESTRKEGIEDKISRTVSRLNEMNYSEEDFAKNISSIITLKESLT